LYAASDLTVSSSLAEGLPNVIGEAMAHGIPAVVTDAGDSALLVGDTGRVVPCADPGALATALHELVTMDGAARAGLGRLARNRIDEEFSMAVMTERYVALWREVADVRN
jgi:glycosyltransferase involved in cell wall biosynthesis